MVNVFLMMACGGPKIPDPLILTPPPAQSLQTNNTMAEILIIELEILEQKPWSDIDSRFAKIDRGCNPELHTYWGTAAESYEQIESAINHYTRAIHCYGLKQEEFRIRLQKRIDKLTAP